jgi:hypothetical protein
MKTNRHPLGLPLSTNTEETCGTCFWSHMAGPGPKVLRCVPSGNKRVEENHQGCSFWQEEIDCLECAACCGPAFDAVEVSPRDPVRKRHPELIIRNEGRFCMPRREGNFCSQLGADKRCVIYVDRPQCCRDFTKASGNCLFARQRIGLSDHWNI